MKPIKLGPRKKKSVLSCFLPKTQSYRVVEYLCDNSRVSVQELNKKCSTGNIADIALKYNPTLRKFGLSIGCHRAPISYLNQFHQPSAMFEWSLCQLNLDEKDKPTKGSGRPQLIDPLFKKRQTVIIDLIREGGYLPNDALTKTRNEQFVKGYSS